MRHRVSWLNNPYLWMLSVAVGLIGVANWPTGGKATYEPTPWELAHDVRPGEQSAAIGGGGPVESFLPAESPGFLRPGSSTQSRDLRVAGSDRATGQGSGLARQVRGLGTSPADRGEQELRP